MRLFVGLGNPGPRYADTRHNIGWMALDAIAEAHAFAPFRAKFQGRLAEGVLGGEKVMLLKPETFMNLSGQSVGEAARFHKLAPSEIVVFHDELDLAPGKLRVKLGGGHAGHNGLRSLHQHIGPDYARVRMGIGHPGDKNRVADYVLHPFHKADREWLDDMLAGVCDGVAKLAAGDAAGFQNAVALRMAPPKPPRPLKPEARPQAGPDAAPARPQAQGADGPTSPFDALKGLLRR
ncbi:aminoacyl-tRNA hydrolase [Rubrimonas cliftonensis]|uniref:Peptidyl-tRNA hydrolase n=1 Tax=Rubrimonas cliftonensis TaxID=89524 RepID=A0A1H3X227_9RHOB|nr:aminoacyl-tRNA hydrolase [Rubrimonas cliftonensis]SDZ92588.1 peptidyl-tRNA hydrolase [Rubrimonas cliftonensis]